VSRWGCILVTLALAGCGSLYAEQDFVLPASFTDVPCGRFARERGQDIAQMGYSADVQVRAASQVYGTCVRDKNL
jgi:hypothetical protein